MEIRGLQKLTLLDYPGHTACTVFSPGCNLRCPFCHNALLVEKDPDLPQISPEELLDFLQKRQGLLDGVCFTGGEPLLQKDIAEVMRQVKDLGFQIKLDTNGFLPQRLAALLDEGLVDMVAMDIKNSPQKYAQSAGLPLVDLSPVQESIQMLIQGNTDYEFRTTVVKELHQPEDMLAIGHWLKGAKAYFLQAFVDSGQLLQTGYHGLDAQTMQEYLALVKPLLPSAQLRGVN